VECFAWSVAFKLRMCLELSLKRLFAGVAG